MSFDMQIDHSIVKRIVGINENWLELVLNLNGTGSSVDLLS